MLRDPNSIQNVVHHPETNGIQYETRGYRSRLLLTKTKSLCRTWPHRGLLSLPENCVILADTVILEALK